MKQLIEKFIYYLRYERNASPETIRDYRGDLELFHKFLTPPGEKTLDLGDVDHRIIREFVKRTCWPQDSRKRRGWQGSGLAAYADLFFKFCVRERITKQNPARLVSTPKLPKRVPRVLTAEELNHFLDTLAGGPAGTKYAKRGKHQLDRDAVLIPRRDRAILELLYASGLRVSELVGLTIGNVDRQGQMLRVLGKGPQRSDA